MPMLSTRWTRHERDGQAFLFGGELGAQLASIFWVVDQSEPHDWRSAAGSIVSSPDFLAYDLIFYGERSLEETLVQLRQIDRICASGVPIVAVCELAETPVKVSLYAAGALHVLAMEYPLSAVQACIRYVSKLVAISQPSDRAGYRLDAQQLSMRDANGKSVVLTLREAAALEEMARKHPQVATQKDLMEAMGVRLEFFDERALQTFISRLRKKLKDAFAANLIVSSRGRGYRSTVQISLT